MVEAAAIEPAVLSISPLAKIGQIGAKVGQNESQVGQVEKDLPCANVGRGSDRACRIPDAARAQQQHNGSRRPQRTMRDLEVVVGAWHELPEAAKEAITAVVRAFEAVTIKL